MTVTAIQFFEIAMLVAFSASWYCSIFKMIRTRMASGKSVAFVVLVCVGYLSGLCAKYLVWRETGMVGVEVAFYFANFVVVAFDLVLVIVIGREERRRQVHPEVAGGQMTRPLGAP